MQEKIAQDWQWIALALRPQMTRENFRNWLAMQNDFLDSLPNGSDPWREDAQKILDKCHRENIHVWTWQNPLYPEWLKRSIYAPPVLYAKGYISPQRVTPIAMVGTRSPSWNGLGNAKALVHQLQNYQCAIVSGLASGIDATCHMESLKLQIPTWAVLAHGLDINPNREKQRLVDNILDQGLIFSHYPPGTHAHKGTFIARNALISGMSKATILVESRENGGAMHTAEFCMFDGRLLLAVPGDFSRNTSQGNHTLLASASAIPIWFPETVGDLCGLRMRDIQPPSSILNAEGLQHMFSGECISFLEIQERCGLPTLELQNTLGNLHIRGLLENLGGQVYRFHRPMNL